MTTGSKTVDGRVNVYLPDWGTAPLGKFRTLSWTGGDAISASTPRASFPRVYKPKGFTRQKRVSRHPLPPQNYSKTVVEQWYTFRPARWSGNSSDSYFAGTPNTPPDLSVTSSLYDVRQEYKLLAKLREKAYGSGFNPAVFVAEGRQALGMISNAAIRIGSAIGRLRARDPHGVLEALGLEPNNRFSKGLRDRSKALSSSWLEVNYGWMPLLKDAEEGAKWLAEALNGGKTPSAGLKARKTWSAEKSTSRAPGIYDGFFTRRVDIFQLQYEIKGVALRNTFAPTIATVASVAWEKLPYSFVADWFVPVGAYIEACRTASDISGTVIRSLKVDKTFLDYKMGPGITPKGSWYGGRDPGYTRMEFSRTVSTEIQVPNPLTTLVDDDLLQFTSWRHAANAVALLTQRNWSALGTAWRNRHSVSV